VCVLPVGPRVLLVGLRFLRASLAACGGGCWLNTVICDLQVDTYIVVWLVAGGVGSSVAPYPPKLVSRMFSNLGDYVKWDKVYPHGQTLDLSWQGDMPESMKKLCDLMNDLYSGEFRSTLR
jgi:hypothetical protein